MRSSFRRGVKDGLVLLPAVLLFGTAFGALAVEAGLAPWLAVLTSVIVVSGAAQFALVGLLAAGAAPVLVATTGLALRHVPMSVRLAGAIGRQSTITRAALAWVLVDETFGMTIAAEQRGETDLVGYKFGADIVLYSGFVTSTVVGAVVGSAGDPEAWGASVFFPLVFVGLAAPLVRRPRDWLVVGAAVATALAAVVLVPTAWQITGAATAAAAIGATRNE
jgi:predicted branched-subunit amino acid permease